MAERDDNQEAKADEYRRGYADGRQKTLSSGEMLGKILNLEQQELVLLAKAEGYAEGLIAGRREGCVARCGQTGRQFMDDGAREENEACAKLVEDVYYGQSADYREYGDVGYEMYQRAIRARRKP